MSALKRLLRSPDTRLRSIEEKFDIGTWLWELDSSELVWSPGLFKVLDLDSTSVVPTLDLLQSLVHPDDQLDFRNAVVLATDARLQDRTFRIIRQDGSLRWLRSKAQTHFDRNGQPTMLFGVVADVTEVEELKRELEAEVRTNKIVAELLGGSIWRASPDGKLVDTADWSKLTGQTHREARDWDELAAIHPDDRDLFREAWATAIARETRYQATVRVRRIDGTYVALKACGLPFRNAAGDVQGWIGFTKEADATASLRTMEGTLDPTQIRAARALLGWSAPRLAKEASVSFSSIRRMEISPDKVRPKSLVKVRDALERHGIRFLIEAGGRLTMSWMPA